MFVLPSKRPIQRQDEFETVSFGIAYSIFKKHPRQIYVCVRKTATEVDDVAAGVELVTPKTHLPLYMGVLQLRGRAYKYRRGYLYSYSCSLYSLPEFTKRLY